MAGVLIKSRKRAARAAENSRNRAPCGKTGEKTLKKLRLRANKRTGGRESAKEKLIRKMSR